MGLNVLTVTKTIKLEEGEKVQPEPGDLDPSRPRLFLHFISSLLTQSGHLTEEPCAQREFIGGYEKWDSVTCTSRLSGRQDE